MDINKDKKIQKNSFNEFSLLNKKSYIPSLYKKTNDTVSLSTPLNSEAKKMYAELLKTKEEQGLIGNLWDSFKNLTKIGAGSNKVEVAIKKLNSGEITAEQAQEILQNYQDGQKTCLDVVVDMISSIVSVGAFVAAVPSGGASLPVGLAVSTALSTGIKVGIKGIDAKTNGREYNSKNLLYDVVTGSVNGLLAPVTNGLGSSLTKTIGCKLGLEITGDVLETGAKNTLKNLIVNQSIDVAGGSIKKRALALGAGMAVDGALGGATDNLAREIIEDKKDKNVLKAATEGFLGGLIMSPIIGGGFRLAGKLGSKIGKKLSFKSDNTASLAGNPFKQNPEIKVEPEPTIDAKSAALPESKVEPAVTPKPELDSEFHIESDVSANKVVDNSVIDNPSADDISTRSSDAAKIEITPEPTKVLTTEQILQNETVKKLKGSLEHLPVDVQEKKEFIKDFLMTSPKTGEKIDLASFWHKSLDEIIDSLVVLDNNDITVVLDCLLDVSILQDRNDIYFSSFYEPEKFVKTCRRCKQRNIFGLFQEMNVNNQTRVIQTVDDFFSFGKISDTDFDKATTLARHLKDTNKKFYLSTLPEFVTNTNKHTIDYMISNDLFDFEHYSSTVECMTDIFFRVKGLDVDSLRKIHKRGLLKPISDEKRFIPIREAKILVDSLSDSQWQKAMDRNLFALKTNTKKELSEDLIIFLAKLDDEIFDRINTRNLLDKVGDCPFNIEKLILLDDEQWQKVIDRKIKIDKIRFYSEERLPKLLSISDEMWLVAEKRGLDFVDEDEFLFLELNDVEWDNRIKRHLDAEKYDNVELYDFESQVRLAKLSDDEFELAQKRNLIKGSERNYNEEAFSEEALFLLKCNDEKFNLYTGRKIQDIVTTLEKKKALLEMSDEQFERVKCDIIPKTDKYVKHGDDKISDLYKLAVLDEKKYAQAIKFVGLDSLLYNQFTYDEILQILTASVERQELVLSLGKKPSTWINPGYTKESLLKLIKYSDDEYNIFDFASSLLSSSQLSKYIESDQILARSFLPNLKQNRLLISKINNSELKEGAKKELIDRLLGIRIEDYTKLTLKEKIEKIARLQEAQNSGLLEKEESVFLNLDEEIIRLQNSIKHVIQTTDVSKTKTKNMFTRFFTNSNKQILDFFVSVDFSKYGKEGLPLVYSRQSFLNDLSSALKKLDDNQQKSILKKLGISVLEKDGKITGYNGIINLKNLSNEGSEGEILALARMFILENKVITDDETLNDIMNSLIEGMPEFINIIGKKQHGTHDFSLDIHSLNVLKSILENPQYQKLNNQDKFVLRLAAVLHDIAKADSVVDKSHEQLCALYAKDILTKDNMFLPSDVVTRVFDLIQNHNWLEQYNKNNGIAPELAVKFRRKNDHKIAQIFAEADLKSVKADGSFFNRHRDMLSSDVQSPISTWIDEINKKGHMFLTNKIIDKSKVPTITKNGKTYRVLDFSKMKSGTDLSQYGFEPGTTFDNLRLFLHAVKDEKLNNIINVINLSDPNYEGFLCASYVSLFNNSTYAGNKFGVSIEALNIDIANASVNNQGSGKGKTFKRFSNVLTGKDKTSKFRDLIPTYIQNALNLTEEEYSNLFAQIQRVKHASQFDYMPEIKIGEKSFSGKEIKEAILAANDQLMRDLDGHHNELNLYTPKSNALFAKVDSFEEVPEELLDIAEKFDLPIYILGDS